MTNTNETSASLLNQKPKSMPRFVIFQSLPLPSGANQNVDDSGLRPSKQPPIPFGGTLTYQCPGVKSVSKCVVR